MTPTRISICPFRTKCGFISVSICLIANLIESRFQGEVGADSFKIMVVHVILTDILVSSATSGIRSWYLKLVSQYNQEHRGVTRSLPESYKMTCSFWKEHPGDFPKL